MADTTRITDYRDGDLTFYLMVYRNYEAADRCLYQLRQHFGDARVIVRSDGDDDERYRLFVGRYNVDYRAEARLFPVENGGAVIERMFAIFFEMPSPYLFKIDPDTAVHRRFRYVPGEGGHFGTLQGEPGYIAVQGGCMGFTADAAGCIVRSGLLQDQRLKKPQAHRRASMYWKILARRADRLGLISFDWTLGWAATALGVPMFDFPEIRSTWKTPVDNPDLRFAITHPTACAPGL
jgi:hypothetical protein